jgi:hypothetical protein
MLVEWQEIWSVASLKLEALLHVPDGFQVLPHDDVVWNLITHELTCIYVQMPCLALLDGYDDLTAWQNDELSLGWECYHLSSCYSSVQDQNPTAFVDPEEVWLW